MTKFEQIGVSYQHNACSVEDANRLFARSCNVCCIRGMQLQCDKCAISHVHKLVVATFDKPFHKGNKSFLQGK